MISEVLLDFELPSMGILDYANS